jgi:hypothetical protein
MRELQLFREYLVKAQQRNAQHALKIAGGSLQPGDYGAIVHSAKAAELLGCLIRDLDSLEKDGGEFIKQFLT